jgi:hypothetical protein
MRNYLNLSKLHDFRPPKSPEMFFLWKSGSIYIDSHDLNKPFLSIQSKQSPESHFPRLTSDISMLSPPIFKGDIDFFGAQVRIPILALLRSTARARIWPSVGLENENGGSRIPARITAASTRIVQVSFRNPDADQLLHFPCRGHEMSQLTSNYLQ